MEYESPPPTPDELIANNLLKGGWSTGWGRGGMFTTRYRKYDLHIITAFVPPRALSLSLCPSRYSSLSPSLYPSFPLPPSSPTPSSMPPSIPSPILSVTPPSFSASIVSPLTIPLSSKGASARHHVTVPHTHRVSRVTTVHTRIAIRCFS
jgi:hypothetical protein